MSDIFISYASSDRERIRPLVNGLESQGRSVWWDREIPPGKTFDQVIEEELNAARCVIVVWSRDSALSEWVKTEASEGAKRGILVPVLIDDVKIPLEFRRIQAAWLVGWRGDLPYPGFDQLSEAVSEILARSASGLHDAEVSKLEKTEKLEEKPTVKSEKKFQEDEPSPIYQEKVEGSPGKRVSVEVQHKKWSGIFAVAGIIALIIVGIIAYKILSLVTYPKIDRFTANPELIKKGEKTILDWMTSNAKEVEIIGIGKVPLSGAESVSPSETTTYTLIAESEQGKAVKGKVTVEVKIPLSPPEISYFRVSPPSIKKGDSSTLSWETLNAKEVEIGGIGKLSLSGTETVSPTETTTYTLIAENEEGKAVKGTVTVEVNAPLPPPGVSYFRASPTRVKKGDSSTLSWETSNAKEVEIVGIGRVSLSGDEKVSPAETTTYTIIAKNERGAEVQREVAVEVGISIPPPEILEFSAKPSTIKKGEKSTLSWETSNAKEVEINGIGEVGLSGSKTVNPKETTAYNIVARNEEDKRVGKKVTVEVRVPVVPAPKIDYFVARPPSIERGSISTLRWQTQNATKVLLGRNEVERTGSLNVQPERTTAYLLTASSAEGRKLEQTVTIEVVAPALPTPRPPSRDMVQNPERYIKIPKWSFFVAGNGVAMMHHVTIENSATIAYKDVRVKVRYYSSGTEVSGTTKVLPVTVPPRSNQSYLDGGIVLGAAPTGVIDGKIEVLGAVAVE